MHRDPTEQATFFGMEKNPTTIRLANMNLAVHGLEGNIHKAITYYEDPHELFGKCDFVMANPPFNVDEVDAEKVKTDPRLPYSLPGVNKKGRVSNGNYLWISYFDSYLNDIGRAGFVMSSQASSAGGEEAKVRRKLIEAGHVDAMMSIRSGFFYTRTVPCELWFEGLVKLVGHDELAANDWSLTPGRYVGVAPEEEDEDFDFAQTMRDIHSELDVLNAESVRLAATIKRNFEALGL